MANTISVHIDAPRPAVDPSLLERFARAMGRVFSGPDVERWSFTQIEVGSLVTEVRPAAETNAAVEREFRRIVDGLSAVAEGRLPSGWDERSLRGIVEIGSLGFPVTLSSPGVLAPISAEHLASEARALLSTERVSFGSVEGVIESVSLLRSPRMSIKESRTGNIVEATFSREHEPDVLRLFGRRTTVTVRGRLTRGIMGSKKKVALETIRELPARAEVRLNDVIGILGDLPADVDSVAWVRTQRD